MSSLVKVIKKELMFMEKIISKAVGRLSLARLSSVALSVCLILGMAIVVNSVYAGTPKSEKRQFNIKGSNIGSALNAFAVQVDSEILFTSDIVKGINTPGLSGEYTEREALEKLLEGTGLGFKEVDEDVFLISKSSSRANIFQGEESTADTKKNPINKKSESSIEEVVTIGTNIEGIKNSSSPVFVFDREEIEVGGYISTEDLIKSLPQNWSGGQPNGGEGNGSDGASYANLRGLGTDATLVLLNGRRLAPVVSGLSVDVSSIPLEAVERVEVMTDGASSIYGSDAVGGVINIVLRDQFNGAKSKVRVGDTSDGGGSKYEVSQLLGASWASGNVLFSYSYDKQNHLDANDRDASKARPDPWDLLPKSETHGGVLRINQQLFGAEFYADMLYNKRDTLGLRNFGPSNFTVEQSSLSLGGSVDINENWSANVDLMYGKNNSVSLIDFSFYSVNADYKYDIESYGAKVNGRLFDISGGGVMLASGVEYRKENLNAETIIPGFSFFDFFEVSGRSVSTGFFELFVPLVGRGNKVKGVDRLELNISSRYSSYNDFGSANSPKLALLWSPYEGMNFRSTWGRSFRAPNLTELNQVAYPSRSRIDYLIDPMSDDGDQFSPVLTQIGRADLTSENSTNWTFGIDYTPPMLPGFNFELTYFSIDFEDRIRPPGATLTDEQFFTSVITRRPDINTDPLGHQEFQDTVDLWASFPNSPNYAGVSLDQVAVIIDGRLRNISSTVTKGIDFNVGYYLDSDYGDFSFNFGGSYTLDDESRVTPQSPALTAILRPDLKLRNNILWAYKDFSVSTFFNYSDSYQLFRNDDEKVSSWTTVDLNVRYALSDAKGGSLDGLVLYFGATNLFNREPPFIPGSASNFSAENASAVGRFMFAGIEKTW